MTDATASAPAASPPADDLQAQLLDTILSRVHPLLGEALSLACVPHGFDAELMKTLRARDDGKDEKLVERLLRFSFVRKVENIGDGGPRYAVMAAERDIILRRFIAANPQGFVEAHRRTLAFREANPNADPVIQAQSRLYHLLVIDGPAGIERLARMFSQYTDERRLAAAERLIATANEIQPYLAALGVPWQAELSYWARYLRARLAQLRGGSPTTLQELQALREDPALPPSPALMGRVVRAYGRALANKGLYVEAIEQYRMALDTFRRQPNSEAEQGYTMINIGDAYVDLAVAARGQRDFVPPRISGWRDWLTVIANQIISLPLILYFIVSVGLRLNPRVWVMMLGQDWVIARLFNTGAGWYRRADRLLTPLGSAADPIQAEEKLAQLHVIMGDTLHALPILETLLTEKEAPLSEYRRARLRAGLGQALLRLGQTPAALEHLEAALPVVVAYADAQLEAQVRSLIAEARLNLGQYAEALPQFDQAMRLYQQQEDIVGATEIAERLQVLEQSNRLAAEAREAASSTARLLSRRHYLRRFQHPALLIFRRLVLALAAALIFLIPLVTTRVEIGSATLAQVTFYASPLLENDTDYSPSLTQGITARVESVFEVQPAVLLALGLVLFSALAYALLGWIIIATTPLRTVQEAQAEAVRLDLQGLTAGSGETLHRIPWQDITHIYKADARLLGALMLDNSAMVVATPNDRLTIRGHTAWYPSLCARIQGHARFTAKQARVFDLSFDALRSLMGVLYLLGALGLLLFTLIGRFAPDVMTLTFPRLIYAPADLYPYLQLGLFIPPLWWFIVQPIHSQLHLHPRSRWLWWVSGVGVGLSLLPLGSLLRHWFLVADIFPALVLLAALGVLLQALWKTSELKAAYSLTIRVALTAVILAACGLNLYRIGQDVSTYHQLVVGNHWRGEGLRAEAQGDDAEASRWFTAALDAYNTVLEFSPAHVRTLTNRAAIEAELGRYEAAINDYTQALARSALQDRVYASRAIAYTGWAETLAAQGDTQAANERLAAALDDFERAIAARPAHANYYLLRGITYHSLGQPDRALADYNQALTLDPANAQALAGQGWIFFEQADQLSQKAAQFTGDAQKQLLAESQETFRRALQSFRDAAGSDPRSASIWLALGYAHFRLKEFDQTLAAWERAVELAPDDPVMIISRGTAHWRLASPAGGDRCANPQATDAEKAEAARQLGLAIDDFTRALALRPDDAFTYRTRAQVEYLLRFCPGYDFKTQLSRAVADYGEAVKRAPREALYWQFKARLEYVLGLHIFTNELENEAEALAVLETAGSDISTAFELDPEDAENRRWRSFLLNSALGNYHLGRGENVYAAGNYELAFSDFETAAGILTRDARAAFKAGLAAVALENEARAKGWYDAGFARASALSRDDARQALQAALDDLSALLETNSRLSDIGQPILEALKARL